MRLGEFESLRNAFSDVGQETGMAKAHLLLADIYMCHGRTLIVSLWYHAIACYCWLVLKHQDPYVYTVYYPIRWHTPLAVAE